MKIAVLLLIEKNRKILHIHKLGMLNVSCTFIKWNTTYPWEGRYLSIDIKKDLWYIFNWKNQGIEYYEYSYLVQYNICIYSWIIRYKIIWITSNICKKKISFRKNWEDYALKCKWRFYLTSSILNDLYFSFLF